MTHKLSLIHALLCSDFESFLHKVFVALSPGATYIPSWHIGAIAFQLNRIRRGEIRRLIINMPPRSLKSITTSVAFPAFVLGHDLTSRITCASYSGDLAKKHSNDFRAILDAPWYRGLFPTTRIGPYKNSEVEIELTSRGHRLATSVGGTLTGRGGNIIITEDVAWLTDMASAARQRDFRMALGDCRQAQERPRASRKIPLRHGLRIRFKNLFEFDRWEPVRWGIGFL